MTTTETVEQLPVAFIAVTLCLNWTLMVYYGFKLKRYKAWLYPIMFIINPFLNCVYMFHSVLTFTDRTWGGPRANVKKFTKPLDEEVLVGPSNGTETAIKASYSTIQPSPLSLPLQPLDKIEGCFVAPERDENGFYAFSDTSTLNLSSPETPPPSSFKGPN